MRRVIYLLIFIIIFNQCGLFGQETLISKKLLIEDTRELLNLIEETHPDPYLNGGGKINFHRKFQKVLQNIPDSGLSNKNYVWLLQPFINAIGDGHSVVLHPDFKYDSKGKLGIPFFFQFIQKKDYI